MFSITFALTPSPPPPTATSSVTSTSSVDIAQSDTATVIDAAKPYMPTQVVTVTSSIPTQEWNIQSVQQEKDLGVLTSTDLAVSHQCMEAASRANRVLVMVRRQFKALDK